MSEGDLRKPEARMRLFQIIMLKCPKHLWYSPECGPWSMWNFLNMNKSVELEEKLMNKRFDHVWQIALGLILYRWQVSHGSHFHWEQPGGSDMFKFPELEELQQFCERCRFNSSVNVVVLTYVVLETFRIQSHLHQFESDCKC